MRGQRRNVRRRAKHAADLCRSRPGADGVPCLGLDGSSLGRDGSSPVVASIGMNPTEGFQEGTKKSGVCFCS